MSEQAKPNEPPPPVNPEPAQPGPATTATGSRPSPPRHAKTPSREDLERLRRKLKSKFH